MDVEVDNLDSFKASKLISAESTDISSLCTNPIPENFCNYKLTNVHTFSFKNDFKLAKAFELTFSNDKINTYECFDGLFTFALKHANNTLSEN